MYIVHNADFSTSESPVHFRIKKKADKARLIEVANEGMKPVVRIYFDKVDLDATNGY